MFGLRATCLCRLIAMPAADFRKGQRVRLSRLGIEHLYPTRSDRASFIGTFVALSRNGEIAKVDWDHRKTRDLLHWHFIEETE